MKTSIIHSIAVCLAAFALPFMVACDSQKESLPGADGDIQAIFTLNLGDISREITRATPTDGEYRPGDGLENFIDITSGDFRCYLFGADGRFISELEVVSVLGLEEKKYLIRLRLKDDTDVKNALNNGCRFMFLANWGSYGNPAPGTTIGDVCTASSAKFDFSQQNTVLSDDNLIPMYGIKEFDNGVEDYKNGKTISDIGTIYMLRAFAKVDVTVKFEDFTDTPEVTSVSLTHSNSKGYKAPANVTKQSDYVTGSWFTDYTPVNIPSDATDIPSLTLTKVGDTGWRYVAYVPEYKNVDEGQPIDSRSQIKICFTVAGYQFEGDVDFCHSDNPPMAGVTPGQHFDIARNNWYEFTVTAKGKDIEWTVDVIPFTTVTLNPDYGLEREEFTGYIVGKDANGRPCWYDPAETPYVPEGSTSGQKIRTPYYLGRDDNAGFVTVNGKEYLLVYTNYERTAANLNHIFDRSPFKKRLLDEISITGYTTMKDMDGYDMYVNSFNQRVWLDSNLLLSCYRTLNEWDRLTFAKCQWGWPDEYPNYWFDILGNRYRWSDGDTKEKRAAIIGEWAQYLE